MRQKKANKTENKRERGRERVRLNGYCIKFKDTQNKPAEVIIIGLQAIVAGQSKQTATRKRKL